MLESLFAEEFPTAAGQTSLKTMGRALAIGDVRAAESAWRDAYGHAIRTRQWESPLAVGEVTAYR